MRTPRQGHLGVWTTALAGLLLCLPIADALGAFQPVRPILECVTQEGPAQYTAVYGYKNENAFPLIIPIGPRNKFTPSPQDRGQPTVFWPGRTPPDRGVFHVPFDGGDLVWALKGPDGSTRTATASSSSRRCPGPTLTGLDPVSLFLMQGGSKALTATIGAAQPSATTITLRSSDPAIASVPASVSIPAGQEIVAVPVAAGNLGIAVVTASLNGSSRRSIITVLPGRPTITSLVPATIQVAQGASGMLTVTISAAHASDTVIPLSTSDAGVVGLPGGNAVTVPAGQLAVAVPVAGLAPGSATVTAGPLNGTSAQSQVTVIGPPAAVVGLAPAVLPLSEGSAGTLTVTLNASQPTDTEVTLTTSDPAVVGLPVDHLTVPAHTLSAGFTVTGLALGTATIAASVNGAGATSAVTVQPPLPTVSALACPATLTVGATAQCTVTLNATQLTDTLVPLATSDPGIVKVPESVTVLAGAVAVAVPVAAGTLGTATLTAGPLHATTAIATVQVQPPPPTLVGLTPSPATLLVGASTTLILTLNAAQATDTAVGLASTPTGIVTLPPSITVPASQVSVPVPVTGLTPGATVVTAGPLNGTTAEVTVTVNQLPPAVTALSPPDLTLPKGTADSLTVTIAPVQSDPTTVPLTSSAPGTVEVPLSVPVPAGSATAAFPAIGWNVGTATVSAGPLGGATVQTTVTVTPPALVTLTIAPTAITLAVGQTQAFVATGTYTDGTTQDLAPTATWTSSNEAVATVTNPGGIVTARAVGQATITATAEGKSATATISVTPPILTVLALTPTLPTRAVAQAVQFQVTGTYTDGNTQDLTGTVTWTSSNPAVAAITSPGGLATALATGQTTITATHAAGMTVSTTLTVTAPVVVGLTISPQNPTKTIGRTLQFTAKGTFSDGSTQTLTSAVTWTSSTVAVATITSPSGLATALAEGTTTITATHASGVTAGTTLTATILPPDPGTVAAPINQSTATPLVTATEFLYTGADPVQTGVTPGAIEPQRVAVLRGKVLARDGNPLAGVTLSILNHPEYGTTLSRTDGLFDLAVNGGGQLILQYQKAGYLPAQRPVTPAWQDYAWLPEVVLIPYDTRVTTIDLTAATPIQVARGNPVTDADGTRHATLLIPQGTTATIQLPGGGTQTLTTLSLRATEYTVGASGPNTMPGPLPPTSAYTYAVELSADEAVTQGVKRNGRDVLLNQPVVFYVENFLNFPVGGVVPVGYYDNTQAAWVPSDNGRIIKVLSVTASLAILDVSGSGTAATPSALAALGITDAERQHLASLYSPGQSLWRVRLPHLSTWDANWGMGCQAVAGQMACQGPTALAALPKPTTCPTEHLGSIIACQNQTLGEAVHLVGSPIQLHYASERTPGRLAASTVTIPLSGATLPAGVQQIVLELTIAGRQVTQVFPALPNQSTTFTWDGLDAYGRHPQGAQPVTLRLGYTYPAVYQTPAQLTRSFGYNGGGFITGSRARETMTFWQVLSDTLGTWDARAQGLGGWTLGVHHAYDPVGRVLYEGTGRQRAAHDVGWVITTLAGTGVAGFSGDGGPATQAQLNGPNAVAVDAQGNVFVVDQSSHRVRRISPDGLITTLAGTGVVGFSGDGGPATQATLNFASHGGGVAVDGQGTAYIADRGNERIRKVGPDGIITTVAGTGVAGFSGDGGPIATAQFNAPFDVVVGRGGSLIITDWGNNRIRQVSPDGIVTTVAGTGVRGFSGDGGPATQAQINSPTYTAVDGQGNLFIADQNNHRIRKVSPGGVITTVAGTGTPGFSGDGGPATSAALYYPATVVVDRTGSLFITDEYNYRVRKVSPGGIITTVAGNGTAGFSGDGGPATAAATGLLYHLAVDGRGALVIGDYANQRVRRVAPALPEFTAGDISIASEDGQALYVFDATGRHLRTQDARTGVARFTFGYDPEGRLITVTDRDNNVTRIERDGMGQPTAIVAPDDQWTTLAVDATGYLATLSNPVGETTRFTSSVDGLLQNLTTPRNHEHRFTYDSLGRLTRDEDPAGGFAALARTETSTTSTTTLTTALNRTSRFLVEPRTDGSTRRVDTAPDGTQTELLLGADASRRTTTSDGTVTTLTPGPDPRFGMQAPIPSALTVRMPSGLTSSLAMTRAVALSDPNNLLSLTSQTDTLTLNGRTATSIYNATAKTITDRSPANRIATTTLDTQGRVVREQMDSLEPVSFAYDPRGRLSTVVQGTGGTARTSTFAHNPEGFLETITDPLSRTVRFTYDPAGRVLTQTLPDLRVIQTTYDANGNVQSITPPSRPAHTFDYTPIDLEASYTPPDLGIGTVATTYTYNQDRQLTQVIRPDGQTLTLNYEPTGGRLSTLTAPTGQTTFTYHPITGTLATIARPGGVGLSYTYDGSLLTGTTWTGPVTGSVTRTYDTDFRVATQSINGGTAITLQYDPDSLLTQAGSLTLTRHAQHGLLTGTTLGSVTDTYTYSTFGELSTYQATYSGSPLLNISYTRDALGRITQKTETIGGATTTTVYGYDTAGRLTDVTTDGTLTAHYVYDANGNRLSVTRPVSGTVSGIYDAQDRVTTYGAIAYTYTSNGDLLTATSGGQTTSYGYDVFGNFTNAILPTGTQIEYVIDGQNRRIGKKVNGVLTQGLLYGSQLRPAAELDGSGAVVARFVYGTRINVPDYMVRGGITYRLLTDHLGSVRLVVNTSTGAIAQRIDHDEFGQVLQDTNPGFQPFGFAGGLYDPDTKLTRFGARDYDAFTGRWTTKDPIGFGGRDPNLYGYTLNNPLGYVDPQGLDVDVCYYADAAAGFGHVGFGLARDERTSGFYNTGNPFNSPGQLREDWQRDIRCKRIESPPAKDECMEKCRKRRQADPGQYRLLSRQCTSYVRECLRECGLPGGSYEGPRPFPFYEGLPNKQ